MCGCESWAVVECLVCSFGRGAVACCAFWLGCAMWCDKRCARRVLCMIYSIILALF